MASLRWWILCAVLRATLQTTHDDRICVFVNADDDLMVHAVQSTWAPKAIVMQGGGSGLQQFWHHLDQSSNTTDCTWFLSVPSASLYVNMPVLEDILRHFDASKPMLLSLTFDQATHESSPSVVSASLVARCGSHTSSSAGRQCLEDATPCQFHELVSPRRLKALVETNGWNAFSLRRFDSCLLAVLNVRGWVHTHHIHDVLQRSGSMRKCTLLQGELSGLSTDLDNRCGLTSRPSLTALRDQMESIVLQNDVCIFVPIPLQHDSDADRVDEVVSMVLAASSTWATNSTVFVLPPSEEEPPGVVERLSGVQLSQLPALASVNGHKYNTLAFRALLVWKHALKVAKQGSCKWVMKVPLWSYVQASALETRLGCFNASMPWFLGASTAAYSPGLEPFLFPSDIAGAILSRGLFENVLVWSDFCLQEWGPEMSNADVGFLDDYAFALCMSDLGKVQGNNYADIETSFIMVDRPSRTLELFAEHSDTVKQCLLVVGTLQNAADLRAVHDWLTWSQWHKAVPCIGESSFSKYSIADGLGNKQPYYDEQIRLDIYYCKDPEMLVLEKELSARLENKDPRDGRGHPSVNRTEVDSVPATGRQHLCIFVPSSAKEKRFVHAAEVALENWATVDTYFVSTSPLSSKLDAQTLLFDIDVETDYAHLPVRTFRLFEALGRPEWAHACDWYMKADADSYMNVPLIAERLRCFDPGEFWFMGETQIAHGNQGTTTRFASGGSGYAVSRALLPKLAAWSPFCLLQLLQHSGGTGMEDVSLSGCLWKWGHIHPTSYLDETEVITSELAFNRTQVTTPDSAATVSPCTHVVHSLLPEQVPIARRNIEKARAQASPGLSCQPDAEKIRRDADVSWAPLDWSSFAGEPTWEAYNSREVEALIGCSAEATSQSS